MIITTLRDYRRPLPCFKFPSDLTQATSAFRAELTNANPQSRVTSGPLPSESGLKVVICNTADHLWRSLALMFEAKFME